MESQPPPSESVAARAAQSEGLPASRTLYSQRLQELRVNFEASFSLRESGRVATRARATLVDDLVRAHWQAILDGTPAIAAGIALVAVGGYGRAELYPFSDVDLIFLIQNKAGERRAKDALRRLNQSLWDAGLRVSTATRTLAECGRFDPENAEFTLSLLDARFLTGDVTVAEDLIHTVTPRLLARDRKKIVGRLLEITRLRHAKYGDTLFHLEPSVKDCPGGLRDVHVCAWLNRLQESPAAAADMSPEFAEAFDFLALVRTFLHFRHHRDDNTLDWESQDGAAAALLGIAHGPVDASYWMRIYFRHARSVQRRIAQAMDLAISGKPAPRRFAFASLTRVPSVALNESVHVAQGRIALTAEGKRTNRFAERDPETVFAAFAAVAQSGMPLARETEQRLERALPHLSANLEDGIALWRNLRIILTAPFAGTALRAMHALGILELVIPEFHGIDALVIRDAYHRYTVDEHTFVLIDTLHSLSNATRPDPAARSGSERWTARFASILRDLAHPDLLFLAALLHDTGKGHAKGPHAAESARLASSVVHRLDLDPYESALVIELIGNHLEMSAALRRDVFDAETIRSFAARVGSPEALRALTLFTYADIAAVHPDALTPWKAENLWRLYLATANFQDRSVDDVRVPSASENELGDVLYRVHSMLRERRVELAHFLEGFPLRYLQTRSPDHIRTHFEMASRVSASLAGLPPAGEIDFRYSAALSEVTLVTLDRPMLFAGMAGALAAWGMNIVTADAFSNAHGIVVDSFHFTDTFRTLELNESERVRFVASLRSIMSGSEDVERMLTSRRRTRRKSPKINVESRVDFDDSASSQSTLLQVVAQDTPGLLHALALTIAGFGCNIEVALIDTEGEMAIDVFYITRNATKLEPALEEELRGALLQAIERNAS